MSPPLDDIHFSFFSGGTMIKQIVVPSKGHMDFFFYGFASSQPFDRLVVGNRPDSRFGLDNIRYGYEGFVPTGDPTAVPEPISAGLVLVGMAALLPALGRRRRPCR
ncbi:MAG: hypothetical protein JJU36_13105 [Phycisphaeraceae bacterium]|nr:hypothetical protein [Phycisphaeraceae bacterium]